MSSPAYTGRELRRWSGVLCNAARFDAGPRQFWGLGPPATGIRIHVEATTVLNHYLHRIHVAVSGLSVPLPPGPLWEERRRAAPGGGGNMQAMQVLHLRAC